MASGIDGSLPQVVQVPDPGTAYRRLSGYHILWIFDGNGIYQVDFQNYRYTGERIIFLGPGQYFGVVAGTFSVKEITVPASLLTRRPQLAASSRVLFTHVYELGAIVPGPALTPPASD